MKKTAKIEFKLEEDLLNQFKQVCEDNGYDMSKRLRLYIQKELELSKVGKNLISVLNIVDETSV
jgi:antitoxin component of RelBE/YafQ-DinJ toxin-antitoxin module